VQFDKILTVIPFVFYYYVYVIGFESAKNAAKKKEKAKGVKEMIAEVINRRRPSQLDDIESLPDTTPQAVKKPNKSSTLKKKKSKTKGIESGLGEKSVAEQEAQLKKELGLEVSVALESPPPSPLNRQEGTTIAPEGSVIISAAEEMRLKALENKALGLNEDGTDPMKSGAAVKAMRAAGIKVKMPVAIAKPLTRIERLKKSVDDKVCGRIYI